MQGRLGEDTNGFTTVFTQSLYMFSMGSRRIAEFQSKSNRSQTRSALRKVGSSNTV